MSTTVPPETGKFEHIDTCFSSAHNQMSDDDFLYFGESSAVGWIDMDMWDETGDAEASQGWCPAVVDTSTTPWGSGPTPPSTVNTHAMEVFSPNLGRYVTLRVPQPLGFFPRSGNGRVDDPDAGWKGRGYWASFVDLRDLAPVGQPRARGMCGCGMLRFLAAVAVVLAVMGAGALIVAAVVSRVAPLAARLEAWWARRSTPIVTAGGPDGKARDRVGRNEEVVGLAAAQGDDGRAADADEGFGGGGFGDGGAGAVDGGDGGG